ncbi:MAG: CDP-alcohol phosphatidyltransferase family protein [Anaerolineae bacterium]|nr:CDP-alcohol phosphatidyltransferase family protein [Anaerolineae bacterium]
MPTKKDVSKHLAPRPTFDDVLRTRAAGITQPVAVELARWKVHPNTVTLVGFLLNVVAGALALRGWVQAAGVMTLLGSSTDALDGALARSTGQQSRFGAFLDSTLDRLSEGTVLLGLLWWYSAQGRVPVVMLIGATLLGSVMVSYTRARAEGVGYACKVGLLTRAPRVVLLGLGMLIPVLLSPILLAMALLTWFTVFQRIGHVYRSAQREP